MKPKGHKQGCGCVVCSRLQRPRRRNGYENQMSALRTGNKRGIIRKNSSVPIGGKKTVRGRSMGLRPITSTLDRRLDANPKGKRPLRHGQRVKIKSGAWEGEHFYVVGQLEPDYYMLAKRPDVEAGDFEISSHRSNLAIARRAASNPTAHYPRTKRGPKGTVKWYILDLFDGRGGKISSRYRKCARAKCATEAAGLVNRKVGGKMVRKVELSGPYSRKPTGSTARK